MLVRNLIAGLKKLPPEANMVLLAKDEDQYREVTGVEQFTREKSSDEFFILFISTQS